MYGFIEKIKALAFLLSSRAVGELVFLFVFLLDWEGNQPNKFTCLDQR